MRILVRPPYLFFAWLASLLFLCPVRSQFIFREDPLALLSGTLRTIQRAACDGETLTLRCPLGTAVSIQLAQYGRPAPGLALCPGNESSSSESASPAGHSNDTCALTPQMQHALLQTVVEACVKKRYCKFSSSSVPSLPSSSSAGKPPGTELTTVPSGLGGDKCAHQAPKFVEVAYKCRPLEFRSKIICENETIQLKCKRNARIAIYSATFGRVLFQSLQCPQPPGVPDETCEASFSTETVMQVCHGKRRCTLSASSSTFGNPCSPQSHLYLRVVYTCVSRRILKDHYQGDLEDDESPDHQSLDNDEMMNENSFESEDYAEPVSSSATSLPPPRAGQSLSNIKDEDGPASNDHPVNYRTTYRPPTKSGSSGNPTIVRGGFFGDDDGEPDDDMLGDKDFRRRNHLSDQPRPSIEPSGSGAANSSNVMGLITEWITSVSFMKENQEKFILYLTLSIAAGILVLLTALIGRLWWQKRRGGGRGPSGSKSIHSSDPIPAFADDLSDVDNDIDLTSLSLPPPPPLLSEMAALNGVTSHHHLHHSGPVPTADGVRGYATSTAGGTIRRPPVEEAGDNHPRSFTRNTNSHYHYYG